MLLGYKPPLQQENPLLSDQLPLLPTQRKDSFIDSELIWTVLNESSKDEQIQEEDCDSTESDHSFQFSKLKLQEFNKVGLKKKPIINNNTLLANLDGQEMHDIYELLANANNKVGDRKVKVNRRMNTSDGLFGYDDLKRSISMWGEAEKWSF